MRAMLPTPPRSYPRYVAIGDSSTEGLDDPDGNGGYRGWADRLAQHLADHQGSVLYANLGIRGRRTRQILEQQLEPACAMAPDLVTIFSGTNDVTARRFDLDTVAADSEAIHQRLRAIGATVLTFTLPDLTPVMPLAALIAHRIRALNQALRTIAARHGVLLVDFAAHPVATDSRLWSPDRLHANTTGHTRIAAALAHALNLPGTSQSWTEPLSPIPHPTPLSRLQAELTWTRQHLLPWLWQHLQGKSSGDPLSPKRPRLEVVKAGSRG